MTNVLEFVPIQGGHTVRAMNGGQQLATAEKNGEWWIGQTHPNGTRLFADTTEQAIMLALGINVQATVPSVDFVATQYTNGMISYKDNE